MKSAHVVVQRRLKFIKSDGEYWLTYSCGISCDMGGPAIFLVFKPEKFTTWLVYF